LDNELNISVVIPLYNGARFIAGALESVLRQSLRPAEIIVVDDGSTDDGSAIVETMAASHPIVLLRKANGGQSSARNMGIAHCHSELIALLDQDDEWYPNHLEELIKPFRVPHVPELGWVYSNLDEVDEDGHMVFRSCLHSQDVQHPKRDLFGCLATDMFVLPSASLVSRKAFVSAGGFDESLSGYEDDDLFLRLFRAGFDNEYIDQSLTRWRIYLSSSSYSQRMSQSRMTYLRKLMAQFPNNPERDRFLTRDYLAPRFFPMVLREYTRAVRVGSAEQIRSAWDDLRFVSGLHRAKVRLFMRLLLPVLRFSILARPLLQTAQAVRPVLRRLLR
jgi:glycosyltransferase involved in cell wall biosynthesis